MKLFNNFKRYHKYILVNRHFLISFVIRVYIKTERFQA